MSEIRPFSTNSTISRTHRPSDPPQPISKPSIHTSQAITHSEPHSNPLPIDYSLTPEDADYLVKAAIDATIDSYGRPKELTYNTFRLMDKALCINNPDSFTLRGIRFSHGRGEAYKCFREAEHKGSTHPLTYFFLAKLSRGADTLYYYDKCIEVGSALGYIGIYSAPNMNSGHRSFARDMALFQSLLEAELTGVIDPILLYKLAGLLAQGIGYMRSVPAALDYCRRALSVDLMEEALLMICSYSEREGIRLLLEVEKKGMMTNRLWETLLKLLASGNMLSRDTSPTQDLFSSYCEKAINNRMTAGYIAMANLNRRSVEYYYKAHKDGVADGYCYEQLLAASTSNEGAHSDHDLVFEYGIRALELITDETRRMPIYIKLLRVLQHGFPRTSLGRGDVIIEMCTKADAAGGNHHDYTGLHPYAIVARVYKLGLKPIRQDGAQALRFYMHARSFYRYPCDGLKTINNEMAEIYRHGIPPIAKDEAKAKEAAGWRIPVGARPMMRSPPTPNSREGDLFFF